MRALQASWRFLDSVELTLLAPQLRLCFVSQERVRRDRRNRGGGGVERPCAPSTANFCFQQVQNSLLDPKKVSKIVSLHAWTQFLGIFGYPYIRHALASRGKLRARPGGHTATVESDTDPPGFHTSTETTKQEHAVRARAKPGRAMA